MVDLKAKTPAAGLLPLEIGKVRLEEVDPGHLTSLTALGEGMEAALKKAHGLVWPEPGQSSGGEGARAIWFGLRDILLMGPAPNAALADHGALVDQSDAWCAVRLEGERVEDVLARLVPVDLRAAHFSVGRTARTPLFHMNASITRVADDAFLILVFRSMAGTLVHDLKQAMAAVASRG